MDTKAFVEVLDELGRRFGIAIDWSSQNVQPYLKELTERVVKYEIYSSAALILFSIFLLILCFLLPLYFWKRKDTEFDGDTSFWYSIVASITLSILPFWIMVFQVIDIIRCFTLREAVVLSVVMHYIPK